MTNEEAKERDYDYIVKNIDGSFTPGHIETCRNMIELFDKKWNNISIVFETIFETVELHGILKYKINKLDLYDKFY